MRSKARREPVPGNEAVAGTVLNVMVLIVLLVVPQIDLAAIPSAAQAAGLLAAGALVFHRLLTFRRWRDELVHAPRFVGAVLTLLAVVAVENFCTWATSASDLSKYEPQQPLQDNVEIGLRWLVARFPGAAAAALGWRVDMHALLYCFVALCLSAAWDAIEFSGFGVATRFLDTVSWTHALRTLSFMVTVLPNPKQLCYTRWSKFPPVPQDAWEFIKIGFSAKRGSGCNDLIISGHGVIYAAVPLALHTFGPGAGGTRGARGRRTAVAVAWLAVAKLCAQEVLDKTHYSVDMLLAVVVTALVWSWRRGAIAASAARWRGRGAGAPADPVPYRLVALVFGVVCLTFLGVHGV